MALPNNLSSLGSIANAMFNSMSANSTAITSMTVGAANSANLTTTTNVATIGAAAYFVANGNVGIGTSTPNATLSVTGNSIFTGNVSITGSANISALIAVGSNSTVNTTAYFVGNSTVNTNITAAAISMNGNSVYPSTGGFRRNRIINGAMQIDQRNNGAAQTFTAGAALAYSVDRFYGYCTGANVTGQRVAGSGTTQYRYQFTGAASVTTIGFAQRIETSNSYDLNNSTAILSVDLSNSLLTTVTWTAYYANTADTFGSLASPTRTQIASGTFTVTSTLANYTTSISIPAAATTGIEIVFTVGAQTSGTWVIGNVQLEAGSLATPFERLSISETLALCQRYYETGQNSICVGGGTQGTLTDVKVFSGFRVTKRVAPTMTFGYSAPVVVSTGTSGIDGTTVFYTAGNSNNFAATFYATAEL
jgi:hypothetical protein